MLISSEAGAAESVASRDDTRFYDDVGCLATDWANRVRQDPEYGSGATAFVRLGSGAWSDVRSAWFARPAGARTAMGSGIVAYATAAEAKAADRDGRALPWADVVTGR